jgi:hypothetical protein
MSNKQKPLETLLKEGVGDLSSKDQLNNLSQDLLKTIVETAFNSELEEHLGYAKHHTSGIGTGNSRNGHYPKTIKSAAGDVEVQVPHDRNGQFEPQFALAPWPSVNSPPEKTEPPHRYEERKTTEPALKYVFIFFLLYDLALAESGIFLRRCPQVLVC